MAWAERGPRHAAASTARRLADLLPEGRLVEIDDSYTLIPEDRPAELAAHVREFMERTG